MVPVVLPDPLEALMMRLLLAVVSILLAGQACAGERKMAGAEIRSTLSGKTVEGRSEGGVWKQVFAASGDTEHFMGEGSSKGRWDIHGDQYCSQWPPGDRWTCYDVIQDGETIIFVSPSGERSAASIAK
jgi:hypothetical protein